MARTKRKDHPKPPDPQDPQGGPTDEPEPLDTTERSSPGSAEDLEDEPADLQPDDVEQGDTAR